MSHGKKDDVEAAPWRALVNERLAGLGLEPAREAEIVEEIAQHLADVHADQLARGVAADVARAAAARQLERETDLVVRLRRIERGPATADRWAGLGEVTTTPARGGRHMIDTLWQDVRYGARLLLKTPAFAAVAILTLALGIGANTAVFTVFSAVVLRPLPYPDADRLAKVYMDNRELGIHDDITSYPNYVDWRDGGTSFAALAAYSGASFNLTGLGDAERLVGAQTTASFFDVLGVRPAVGRAFTADEETTGRDQVLVLSDGLAGRLFGSAADAVGRRLTLNAADYDVIGVMPPGFEFPWTAAFWKPLAPSDSTRRSRAAYWLPVVGRLKPGASIAQAQAELSSVASRLEQEYPRTNTGMGVNVVALHRDVVGDIEPALVVLFAAVGVVLLIACANLASLMLARTTTRARELAIRATMGASRGRLARQLLTECVLFSASGAALGLALAVWGVNVLVALGGDAVPRQAEIAVDGRVIGFVALLALATGVVFGLVPAWQSRDAGLAGALKEGGRSVDPSAGRRARHALVAVEVALAVVLLAGAGLALRSFERMQHVERGFRIDDTLALNLTLPRAKYDTAAKVAAFYRDLMARVGTLPGVRAAAATTGVFLADLPNSTYFGIEGQPMPPPGQRVEVPYDMVTPGYFEALGIRFAAGRAFTDADNLDADAPPVVVINETMARMAWPDADAIGRRLKFGPPDSEAPWLTVVGVIHDLRRGNLRRAVRPEVYVCEWQAPQRSLVLLARADVPPERLVAPIRAAVQAIDPEQPVYNARTLGDELDETMAQPRLNSWLLGAFAALALVLAAIGIYGVLAYAVSHRTQEMGVRMALGAQPGDVVRLVVWQGLAPVVAGAAVGLAGALILTRFMTSQLFEVAPSDPLTFGGVVLMIAIAAAAACWVPARRATRVDPVAALRAE